MHFQLQNLIFEHGLPEESLSDRESLGTKYSVLSPIDGLRRGT